MDTPMVARPVTVSRAARPVKLLVPLIKDNLRQGNTAGLEYYRRAGDKLREARTQVAPHR